MRAVRTAANVHPPGRRLMMALGGIGTATAMSLGLAAGVSRGITDPRDFPEPGPVLLESAQQDPSSAAYSFGSQPPAAETAYESIVAAAPLAGSIAPAEVFEPVAPATVETPAAAVPAPATSEGPQVFAPGAAAQPAAPAPAAPPAPAPAPVVEAPAPAPVPAGPGFYIPANIGSDAALEQTLLALINNERANAGLPAYTLDSTLTRIARTRSQQMVDKGYFGHVDPESGQYMYTALLAHYGIGYAWAGENLAMNNYNRTESPGNAIIRLMNSPTHRANILAGDFTRIGVGVVVHPDGRIFYSMIFLG